MTRGNRWVWFPPPQIALDHVWRAAGKPEEMRASALAQMREALRLGSILLRIPRLASLSPRAMYHLAAGFCDESGRD
jgi:hypothetical protein